MKSFKEHILKREHTPPQSKGVDEKLIFSLFQKFVREEYGARGVKELEPAAYDGGILSVKSNNPLYSSELWMRREIVMGRINTTLEQEAVTELKLVRYMP